MYKTFVVLYMVAASLAKVSAVTEEEKQSLRAYIEPIVAECSKELAVSSDELKAAKESRNPDDLHKCFLGCLMKKAGVLNEKGIYDVQAGLGTLKEHFKDTSQFDIIARECAKVNDEPVSDGEAGCERAKLLLGCAIEHNVEIPL